MNLLIAHSGLKDKLLRIKSLLKRYGFFNTKFEKHLRNYIYIIKQYNSYPTFPVTGVILERHADIIKRLKREGAEIAIHGYTHIDYSHISGTKQIEHFKKAAKIFNSEKIPFSGFRSPYLRWNKNTMNAIQQLGCIWDSSKSVFWNVIQSEENSSASCQLYLKILDFCHCENTIKYPSLPYFRNNFVEIPVSIPDDEALVDRLKITDKQKIGDIWCRILEETYERGELFTLQLHPERIFLCDKALEIVLIKARQKNPPVWIAQLGEIAKWWKEKDKFEAKIHQKSKNVYQIDLSCSDRATILIKNLDIQNAANTLNAHNETNETDQTDQIDENWYGSYKVVNQKDLVVKSNCRPVLGLALDSSLELISFLRQDGYIIEVSDKKSDYGIYLEGINEFSPDKKLRIIKRIESSDAPLVRFWRWPNRARSTLSITGDIDAITIWDFALRVKENE